MVLRTPQGAGRARLRAGGLGLASLCLLALTGCGDGRSVSGAKSATAMSAKREAPDAAAPEHNTEAYDRVLDNPFKLAAREPLSTFSADVDTASYSNVRRFLNEGKLPPADAVRVEELVNYFTYDYPAPADGFPVKITPELAECPWNPKHKLLRVGVQTEVMDPRRMPPRNFVFLVDVSGSMNAPNRLPLLQESLKMLTGQLTARDCVAIVVYAGSSGLVLPPTPGDRTGLIRSAIDRLRAGGSTNGGDGIQLAYQVAQEAFIPGGVNRVILGTDGDFNVGVTSPGELVRLIEEKRKSGVYLSVLGFGMGNLKDSTLEKLAHHGNGHYAYIDSLAEARKLFVEQGAALVTVAKDVKFQVEFNPERVAGYRLIGYENRLLRHQDFNDDQKDAGDLGSGHTVTVFYELVPAGKKVEVPGVDPLKYQEATKPTAAAGRTREWLTVKLRYKDPQEEKSKLLEVPVTTAALKATPSADFQFAAAVAAFGMLLRDSPHKGRASFELVQELAQSGRGADADGHRGEFLKLVRTAAGLKRAPAAEVRWLER
jgi:Ca-activated chloride channel homolog